MRARAAPSGRNRTCFAARVQVVALPAPTEREKSQILHYSATSAFPAAGGGDFDHGWYNRAGVEQVMGFANDEQVQVSQCGAAGGTGDGWNPASSCWNSETGSEPGRAGSPPE